MRTLNGSGRKRMPLPEDLQTLTKCEVMFFENDPAGYQNVPCVPVSTTVAASIPAGTQTVTPAAMTGIIVGSRLNVDTGTAQELVTVTAVTATTFTGAFNQAHTGPVTIIGNPDVFLEPQNDLMPGWPYQWLEFGLLPTTSVGAFLRGHRTVRLTGNWGWSAVPSTIVEATVQIVAAIQKRRQAGFMDTVGTTEMGTPIIGKFVPQYVRMSLALFSEIHIGSSAPGP